MRVRSRPAVDRFMEKINVQESGCWIWTGSTFWSGYGNFNGQLAHRASYELFVGPIPAGMQLDHVCHDETCRGGTSCLHRRCVRPVHLRVATNRENVLRGNSPPALNAAKTHCRRGHEFTHENTRIETSGSRRCLKCARLRNRGSAADAGTSAVITNSTGGARTILGGSSASTPVRRVTP